MSQEIILTFPQFITHVPKTKNTFIKIGYHTIYSGLHFAIRSALISAMHSYIEKNIPENLELNGEVCTSLIIYAPINFGNVKMITDKSNNKRRISWKPAKEDYKPSWDVDNLSFAWIKCLNDVIVKKGIVKDDSVKYIRGGSYEFREIENFEDRKLVYTIKSY